MSFQNWSSRVFLLFLFTAPLAGSALAQYNHPPEQPPTPGTPTLHADLVKTGLYVFSGGGGNSLLRLSANGFILVNAGLPSEQEVLLRKIKRISDQPIRALILTDSDLSHAGAIGQFLQGDTRIIAQQHTAGRLASPAIPELTTPGLITFENDYTLRLGGVEAQLLHFGNAHTDGDTVVYFPNLKVVAAGALIGPDVSPNFSSGGSLIGWRNALRQMLKLDFDVAVPVGGPMQNRAEVEAFKARVDELVNHASCLVTDGATKGQFVSELKKDESTLNLNDSQLLSFYNEFSTTAQDGCTRLAN